MTRIAIIGNSFAGHAALKTILKLAAQYKTSKSIDVHVIDPRAGFVNILAIPGTIVSQKLAELSYSSIDELGISWSSVSLTSEVPRKQLPQKHLGFNREPIEVLPNVRAHFIQGHVTSLLEKSLTYVPGPLAKKDGPQLLSSGAPKNLSFDYCVIATGRARNWPFDPIAADKESFLKEMASAEKVVRDANSIAVIGGGALGVEIAGEIKHSIPEKKITLVHPYSSLPPEALVTEEFREGVKEMLESVGVDLELESRANQENEHELRLVKKSGHKMLNADLQYWCNSHSNNLEFLKFSYKTNKTGEIKITDKFNVLKDAENSYLNIYAVGDVVDFPKIKTAGLAFCQGEVAGKNVIAQILDEAEEARLLPEGWPWRTMVLVAGDGRNVYLHPDGNVLHDDKDMTAMYKDYRTEQIKTFNGFDL